MRHWKGNSLMERDGSEIWQVAFIEYIDDRVYRLYERLKLTKGNWLMWYSVNLQANKNKWLQFTSPNGPDFKTASKIAEVMYESMVCQ